MEDAPSKASLAGANFSSSWQLASLSRSAPLGASKLLIGRSEVLRLHPQPRSAWLWRFVRGPCRCTPLRPLRLTGSIVILPAKGAKLRPSVALGTLGPPSLRVQGPRCQACPELLQKAVPSGGFRQAAHHPQVAESFLSRTSNSSGGKKSPFRRGEPRGRDLFLRGEFWIYDITPGTLVQALFSVLFHNFFGEKWTGVDAVVEPPSPAVHG